MGSRQLEDEAPQDSLLLLRSMAHSHNFDINVCEFSYPLGLVFTGSKDCLLKVWDFQNMKPTGVCIGRCWGRRGRRPHGAPGLQPLHRDRLGWRRRPPAQRPCGGRPVAPATAGCKCGCAPQVWVRPSLCVPPPPTPPCIVFCCLPRNPRPCPYPPLCSCAQVFGFLHLTVPGLSPHTREAPHPPLLSFYFVASVSPPPPCDSDVDTGLYKAIDSRLRNLPGRWSHSGVGGGPGVDSGAGEAKGEAGLPRSSPARGVDTRSTIAQALHHKFVGK